MTNANNAHRVYLLFHETNTGHSDESDGYVEAIYSTQDEAEAARLAALRKLVAEGAEVWIDPDDSEKTEHLEWEHDFHVEEHQVMGTTAPAAPDHVANARLIAAAPDLLAIVDALVTWWDDNDGMAGPHAGSVFDADLDGGTYRTWNDVVHAVRAATR